METTGKQVTESGGTRGRQRRRRRTRQPRTVGKEPTGRKEDGGEGPKTEVSGPRTCVLGPLHSQL